MIVLRLLIELRIAEDSFVLGIVNPWSVLHGGGSLVVCCVRNEA
jgi:hypothetical protein